MAFAAILIKPSRNRERLFSPNPKELRRASRRFSNRIAPFLTLVAKSIFTLGIQRIQAQSERRF
jgi:hypothetical protein